MYKPFLSYNREDAPELEVLRGELVMRGAGGWQDTRELRLGQPWMAAFRIAISRKTGGLIWFGTRKALSSTTICKVEVPFALRRGRRRKRGPYPVIPLFVDLQPGQDAANIKAAFGARWGQRLLDLHGVVRGNDETLQSFSRRAARQYVQDLIRAHPDDHLRVAITTGREPTGQHDLSLDWRSLVDGEGQLGTWTVSRPSSRHSPTFARHFRPRARARISPLSPTCACRWQRSSAGSGTACGHCG